MYKTLMLSLLLVGACDARVTRVTTAPKEAAKSCKAKKAGFGLHTTMKKITWPADPKTGTYPITVCWNDWKIGDRVFPVQQYAPDLQKILPERKKWVQEIVEKEWNTKTNLRFIGWKSCAETPNANVIVQPMSSRLPTDYCGVGQSCVNTIGKNDGQAKGKIVYLNMLFGDEFLYASKYSQSTAVTRDFDPKKSLESWWIPSACAKDFNTPWSTVNSYASAEHRIDINRPENMEKFLKIYESCSQACALHEFGHTAGFLHEQLRRDDSATEAQYQACLDYIEREGVGSNQAQARQQTPIGMLLSPFDSGSIMSYCRVDPKPTLTDLDIKGTLVAYPVVEVMKEVPKPTPEQKQPIDNVVQQPSPVPNPLPLPGPAIDGTQSPNIPEPVIDPNMNMPILSTMEPGAKKSGSTLDLEPDCE